MPTIEGLTPSILWTTAYGLVALCLLFMVIYKVYDAIHTISERRRKRSESQKPDFAEEVSQKVIEKLEPRFRVIETNLAKDKNRLDIHEQLLSNVREGQTETRNGLVAICKYLMAMAQFSDVGSNPEMKAATAEMTRYLATKIGGN